MTTTQVRAPEQAARGGKRINAKIVIPCTLILLAVCGYAWRQGTHPGEAPSRQVLYYQDSMHPWIKSDKPGKCTVCAMDLTAIYEGDRGFAGSENLVVLNSNNVTVLNVQTEEVARGPLYRTLRAAGTLEADNTRKTIIGAPAPGRIDAVTIASAGVPVKRGQVLATFYSPDLSFQTRRYIFRDRITSREEMSARPNPLGSSRHAPRMNEATGSSPIASTEQADPFYNDLLSPQSGTVVERSVFDGQYVAEGDRLFVIVDCSVLWFRFDVYEQQLAWLTLGQEVEITVPAAPGRSFKAAIAIIEPSFQDATRTAKVRADVENPLLEDTPDAQHLLRLGMYADGRIRAVAQDVLVAPRSAILFPGGAAYAYLDKGDGAYEFRQVQLGRQGDTHWEILTGLEEGERVVTSGNVLIDAQAQFVHGTKPALDASTPEGEMSPEEKPLTPEQQNAVAEFLNVADGISAALAADKIEDLKQHTARLPQVVPPVAAAMADEPTWHDLIKRLEASSQWGQTADLAAARKAFLPFSTNVVELVEKLRSEDAAFQSLKIFFCPMAPKPGVWFQARGSLRNPYYGAKMLTCGEEVKARSLARKPAKRPMLAHSGAATPTPSGSGSPMNQPAATKTVPATTLSEGQFKSLDLLLIVANRLSEALAADQLENFQQTLVKLPALLPVIGQEFPAGHAWSALLNRINTSCACPAPTSLTEARKVFLPLSTNLVELVQQLRRDEPAFESLKVFECSMAPAPGLWFQSQGPLRNPYFGAKMLSCGEEVAAPAKETRTVNHAAPASMQAEVAQTKPALLMDEGHGPGGKQSEAGNGSGRRLASVRPFEVGTNATRSSRGARFSDSANALRSRIQPVPAAAAPAVVRTNSLNVVSATRPRGEAKPASVSTDTQAPAALPVRATSRQSSLNTSE